MKKLSFTLEDMFNLPTSVIYNPDDYKAASGASIDSRDIKPGELFIALKGEHFDGHKFVNEAVKKGANAVVVNEAKYGSFEYLDVPVITVKNTTAALGDLAETWREKLNTKVIGITGSSGKTTTKEILASLLSSKFKVNKTEANNNNHIGVPLTILSTNNSHEVLVAELGSNHFGEISYSANILRPDYALITNIGDSHLEFLKDRKGVLQEKISLFESTLSRNGYLFINNDDKMLKKIFPGYLNRISFGFSKNSDVKGKILSYNSMGDVNLEINFKDKKIIRELRLDGNQNALNFLASAAVAFKLGLTKAQILSGIEKLKSLNNRLNVKELDNFILINDTYNSNPDSAKFAFDFLKKIKKYKRKIAVLGDMLELGEQSIQLHKELAKEIKKNEINEVYSTGKFMKYLDGELKSTSIIHKHFKNRNSLFEFLSENDFSKSVILMKGSRGMKMEEFITIFENK